MARLPSASSWPTAPPTASRARWTSPRPRSIRPPARRLRQLPGQPGRAQQCLPGAAAGAAARHHRRLRDGGRHRRQGGAQERQDRWRAERQLAGQRRPGRR
ncbi:hypothetical protein G6F55_014294 [Rhizopus delemar]|nr:hypothetical protein G6F55_014294 [Rhizopus delemar]